MCGLSSGIASHSILKTHDFFRSIYFRLENFKAVRFLSLYSPYAFICYCACSQREKTAGKRFCGKLRANKNQLQSIEFSLECKFDQVLRGIRILDASKIELTKVEKLNYEKIILFRR